MEFKRKRARIIVDIEVTLTTVLDSIDARIIDLSEHGAQVVGAAVPTGSKFQIEYMGQTIYAQCMWSEIDRMGVRFPFSMTDGPLHDALLLASPSDGGRSLTSHEAPAGEFLHYAMTGPSTRRATTSFGRRSMS